MVVRQFNPAVAYLLGNHGARAMQSITKDDFARVIEALPYVYKFTLAV